MKTRSMVSVFALWVFAVATCFASDSSVGSWKLNESKSKIPAGASKNTSVVYTEEGDNLKAVIDGVDAKGNATHSEWTGKFDGKDYAVTGDPNIDTRSITKVDEHHMKIVQKKGGKTIGTGTIKTSADDKTRTVTTHGTTPDGKKVTATYVYERQ